MDDIAKLQLIAVDINGNAVTDIPMRLKITGTLYNHVTYRYDPFILDKVLVSSTKPINW